jgi:beta-1,4-N-acetylglucosaminyltransferase
MILVTVGTQFFDALIDEVDRLAAVNAFDAPVLAQIGLAKRLPKHVDHVPFDDNIRDKMNAADLIITHAGTGSLIECITSGRPFIAVVNDTKAGNHQLEFLEALSGIYDFCWIASPHDLESALPQARPARSLGQPGLAELAEDIRDFLNGTTTPPSVRRHKSEPTHLTNTPCLSASE